MALWQRAIVSKAFEGAAVVGDGDDVADVVVW